MSIADEIQKLYELRKSGVISDTEFEQQKKLLLEPIPPVQIARSGLSDWDDIPLKNKLWFQLLIAMFLTPIGVILMLTCQAYTVRKLTISRVGKGTKALFIALSLFLWILLLENGG